MRPSSSPSSRRSSSSSSRVANRRGTSPAARLAAFQLPKCSITVCGWTCRLRVGRELAHRRRAAEPLGADAAELVEDLLVRSSACGCRPGRPASACRSIRASARYWGRRAIASTMDRAIAPNPQVRAEQFARLQSVVRATGGATTRRVVASSLERQDPLEGGDAARAELRCPRARRSSSSASVGGPGGPVDAGREHRVERVGDVDDPRAERDLLALEAVRIAGAVEALVVVAGSPAPRRSRKPRRSMMRAPSSAWRCMSAHSCPVRLAGLSRIASGIASLPMSWKSAAWPRRSSSACERPSSRADRERELLHAARVAGGVRVRARRRSPRGSPSRAVERSLSSLFACSSDTFCVWIVSAACAQLLRRLAACARR